MGKVFSVEELTHGEFPEEGAHHLAAIQMMEGMQQIGEKPGMDTLSYMIHGSVGVGKENIRSDIDFIAVYPDALALDSVSNILAVLANARAQHKVPIDYNLMSDRQAVEGPHRIYPMFGEYLRRAQDDTSHIVGRPADMIVVPNGDAYEADMLQYLAVKQGTFMQAITNHNGHNNDLHQFGRAFELDKALSAKYRRLGEMGLTRIFTPSKEGSYLRYTSDRIAELAEEVMILQDEETIGVYKSRIELYYLDVLKVAAKVCFSQLFEYRAALGARNK